MNKRQTMAIAVVIAIGVVLGGLILFWTKMPSTSANTAREMPETKGTQGDHAILNSDLILCP